MTQRHWTRSPVAGGVVGLFAGGLTIMLLERLGHLLFGVGDPTDLSSVTGPMFAAVLVAWVVGTWVAATVATYWARSRSTALGLVMAAFVLAGAISNMVAFPHPTWMMVAAVVLIPTAGLLAVRGRARAVAD